MQTFNALHAHLIETTKKLQIYQQDFTQQTMGIEEVEAALNALPALEFNIPSLSLAQQETLQNCLQELKFALKQLAQTIEAYKANLAADVNTIKTAKKISNVYSKFK
jgi:hypothetical protein